MAKSRNAGCWKKSQSVRPREWRWSSSAKRTWSYARWKSWRSRPWRRSAGSRTRLLINSRTDVALACGAHGVHLPAHDLAASEVRAIFVAGGQSREPVIGVSAHSAAEVASAEAHGADFAVFAPVFEKSGAANREGLEQLRRICHRTETAQPPMPVLALGGITLENAQQCVEAGAAGIAAIRLFQQNDVHAVVKKLRESV